MRFGFVRRIFSGKNVYIEAVSESLVDINSNSKKSNDAQIVCKSIHAKRQRENVYIPFFDNRFSRNATGK